MAMDDDKAESVGGVVGEKAESSVGVDGDGGSTKKTVSPSHDEALKKCLQENKGDQAKCKAQVEAYNSSFKPKKPLTPLRLRSGSLTDV